MLRSGNPTLKAFERPQTWADLNAAQAKSRTMTVQGTVNAAFILVSLCAASAIATWMVLSGGTNAGLMYSLLGVGSLVSFITCIILCFAPKASPFLAPVYAVSKGSALGALSLFVALQIGGASGPATGIVFQALILTFGLFFALLIAYTSGLIRVGTVMKRIMITALGGVMLFALASIVLSLVGVNFPLFHEMFGFGKTGLFGIGFSVFMLVLGSLFLVWDFQTIEEGAQAGAPKYMEWYGAFSLLVTLAWIYVEALRLLAKLRGKD